MLQSYIAHKATHISRKLEFCYGNLQWHFHEVALRHPLFPDRIRTLFSFIALPTLLVSSSLRNLTNILL